MIREKNSAVRVLIMTDIEGVAGVTTFYSDTTPDGKYYEQSRALLTGEVNAAVDGLRDSGADDVMVFDGHGSGGIIFEQLHADAKLIHGRPCAPREVLDPLYRRCDAAVMVGQHAMAGTVDGNLSHTQNSRTIEHYKLNGKYIGEIAQFALTMGALGVPLIFLSGDEAACKEADEIMPGMVTCAVKKGLSRNSALSLSASKARAIIREGAATALDRHKRQPWEILTWKGPFVLEKKFFHSDLADAAASHPLATRTDALTVEYRSDDILKIIHA